MKRLRVELEIEVLPLSEEEQSEMLEQLGPDDEEEDEGSLFDPDDYSPRELAEVIEGAFHEEAVREMFAGSSIYVTFGDVTIKGANWS